MDSISTGVEGLDDILGGGLPPAASTSSRATPASARPRSPPVPARGRATRRARASTSRSPRPRTSSRRSRASHGWSLDGIAHLRARPPTEQLLRPERQNTLFHPSEVELAETTRTLLARGRAGQAGARRLRLAVRAAPARAEPAALPPADPRAQAALRRPRCTVLLLDDRTSEAGDSQLQSLAHGVIELEQLAPEYGAERRRLRVIKLRGVALPRRLPRLHHRARRAAQSSRGWSPPSTTREFAPDGCCRAASPSSTRCSAAGSTAAPATLFIGPGGRGQIGARDAVRRRRGARGETRGDVPLRRGLGTLLRARRRAGHAARRADREPGRIAVQQIDPAEMSPGEFVARIRARRGRATARRWSSSTASTATCTRCPRSSFLVVQLHELLSYLRQRGVVTHPGGGAARACSARWQSPVDVSYLADTVLLLRYFEARGEVRKAHLGRSRSAAARTSDTSAS